MCWREGRDRRGHGGRREGRGGWDLHLGLRRRLWAWKWNRIDHRRQWNQHCDPWAIKRCVNAKWSLFARFTICLGLVLEGKTLILSKHAVTRRRHLHSLMMRRSSGQISVLSGGKHFMPFWPPLPSVSFGAKLKVCFHPTTLCLHENHPPSQYYPSL